VAIIAAVAAKPEPVVFLLWGRQAQRAGARIDSTRHVILTASHPSPRPARRPCRDASPFCGSAPFSQANAELARRRQPPSQWDLEPGQPLPYPAAIVSPL
jgi:uracil-DNA glycosylase